MDDDDDGAYDIYDNEYYADDYDPWDKDYLEGLEIDYEDLDDEDFL
jgi:hypothetical protein